MRWFLQPRSNSIYRRCSVIHEVEGVLQHRRLANGSDTFYGSGSFNGFDYITRGYIDVIGEVITRISYISHLLQDGSELGHLYNSDNMCLLSHINKIIQLPI